MVLTKINAFPGAEKTAAATVPVNEFYCGSMMGLATAIAAANTDALSKTVCCKYSKPNPWLT